MGAVPSIPTLTLSFDPKGAFGEKSPQKAIVLFGTDALGRDVLTIKAVSTELFATEVSKVTRPFLLTQKCVTGDPNKLKEKGIPTVSDHTLLELEPALYAKTVEYPLEEDP